ncbi:hypothetical protein SISSUDRAFT_543999 [Sistotremastrum suecicum HHB10207 ss-3]|uniref:Uncharacterized protein n=1 Tax=Sistotremastrum suecicum HHB10207 ss-3 TaxID=1314776 RepID=A0A165XNG5_9AGAM|nr:hypothetical protein SISSUDRAFT_543999 [Sistotremastrum suecicum HHB10207 ss-3]
MTFCKHEMSRATRYRFIPPASHDADIGVCHLCPADPVVSSWNLTSKRIRCTCFPRVGESHLQSSQVETITDKVLLSSPSLLRLIV